jgi:hypothetical protein
MKKTKTKLNLSHETIRQVTRQLSSDELREVGGASSDSWCPGSANPCMGFTRLLSQCP